jgi:hypothetical protein
MNIPFSLWLALGFLALVHLIAGKLRFLDVIPRSRWLSAGGGISVAYAFVRLLPELQEHQQVLEERTGAGLAFLEHHAYLVAAAGLAAFYGLERAAKQSRSAQRAATAEDVTSPAVFWLSISVFAVYNMIIGYVLLQRDSSSMKELALFTLAMALHFLVNDYGLHQHHKRYYRHWGRWIIAAAVIAGGIAGSLIVISPMLLSLLVAFLTGGIILNVLKEELPEERESRFLPFALGVGGYALLLLFV